MLIRLANENDVEEIAKNNVLLAKETENVDICYYETFNGVKKVIENVERQSFPK